jgi:hypothetical protein
MKNSASLKQEAIKPKRCQAKECAKFGSIRFVLDRAGNINWTYLLCDEHFHLLSNRDKNYIARTEGTKGD